MNSKIEYLEMLVALAEGIESVSVPLGPGNKLGAPTADNILVIHAIHCDVDPRILGPYLRIQSGRERVMAWSEFRTALRGLLDAERALAGEAAPRRLPVWPEGVRCETCRHWAPKDDGGDGTCSRIKDGDETFDDPIAPWIYVYGAAASSVFRSPPTFLCKLWEPKS
jgi:hypothetical protein